MLPTRPLSSLAPLPSSLCSLPFLRSHVYPGAAHSELTPALLPSTSPRQEGTASVPHTFAASPSASTIRVCGSKLSKLALIASSFGSTPQQRLPCQAPIGHEHDERQPNLDDAPEHVAAVSPTRHPDLFDFAMLDEVDETARYPEVDARQRKDTQRQRNPDDATEHTAAAARLRVNPS